MREAVALLSKEPTLLVGGVFLLGARREFRSLEEWMLGEEALDLPLHDIERCQAQKMKEIMRLMLQAHINARGSGDAGRALEVIKEGAEEIELYTHKRLQERHQETIFGKVDIDRIGYGGRCKESVHPKDESLQLPKRSFSYELLGAISQGKCQGAF